MCRCQILTHVGQDDELWAVEQGERGDAVWDDAVERACAARAFDDAAAWCRSEAVTLSQYRDRRMFERQLHEHAAALRAAGGESLLAEPNEGYKSALEHLSRGAWTACPGRKRGHRS